MMDTADLLLDDCHQLRNIGRPGYEYLMESRRSDESAYATAPPSGQYDSSKPWTSATERPPSSEAPSSSPPSIGYGRPTSTPTSPPSGYGGPTSSPSGGYGKPTSSPSSGHGKPTSPPSGYGRRTSPPSGGYDKPSNNHGNAGGGGYGKPSKSPSDNHGKPSGDTGYPSGGRYDGSDRPGSPGKGKPYHQGDGYTKSPKPSLYGSTEVPCKSLKARQGRDADRDSAAQVSVHATSQYRESLVEESKPSQCGDCSGCYSGASGTCLDEYSPRLCWTAGLTWCGAPAAPPAPTPAKWDSISWGPKPEWVPFSLEWPPRASYFTDSYSYADGEWVEAGDSPAQAKACTPDPRYEHLSRPAWYPPQLSWPPLSCGDFWDTAPAPPTSLALTDRGIALLKTNMVPLVTGCALVVLVLGVAVVRRSLRRHRERREQEMYEDNSHYQPLL